MAPSKLQLAAKAAKVVTAAELYDSGERALADAHAAAATGKYEKAYEKLNEAYSFFYKCDRQAAMGVMVTRQRFEADDAFAVGLKRAEMVGTAAGVMHGDKALERFSAARALWHKLEGSAEKLQNLLVVERKVKIGLSQSLLRDANILEEQHNFGRARHLYRRAHMFQQELLMQDEAFRTRKALGNCLQRLRETKFNDAIALGPEDGAREAVEQAIHGFSELNESTQSQPKGVIGCCERPEGRWDTAKLLLEKARMSTLAVEPGAVELIDEAKTLFLCENDLMGVAEADICLSEHWIERGHLGRCKAALENAVNHFRTVRLESGVRKAMQIEGRYWHLQGDSEKATALLAKCVDEYAHCNDRQGVFEVYLLLADIQIRAGDHGRARELLSQAAYYFEETISHVGMAYVRLRLSLLDRMSGKLDKAEAHASFARDIFKKHCMRGCEVKALSEQAQICALKNDCDMALSLSNLAVELAGDFYPAVSAHALFVRIEIQLQAAGRDFCSESVYNQLSDELEFIADSMKLADVASLHRVEWLQAASGLLPLETAKRLHRRVVLNCGQTYDAKCWGRFRILSVEKSLASQQHRIKMAQRYNTESNLNRFIRRLRMLSTWKMFSMWASLAAMMVEARIEVQACRVTLETAAMGAKKHGDALCELKANWALALLLGGRRVCDGDMEDLDAEGDYLWSVSRRGESTTDIQSLALNAGSHAAGLIRNIHAVRLCRTCITPIAGSVYRCGVCFSNEFCSYCYSFGKVCHPRELLRCDTAIVKD